MARLLECYKLELLGRLVMISVKSDWELFTKVERGCVGFISNFNTHEFPRLMTIHRLTTQHVKKLQKN